LLLAGVVFLSAAASSPRAEDARARAVVSCFETTATRALKQRPGDDDLSQNLAVMAAGHLCFETVASFLNSCLAQITERREDPASYYHCIGVSANACLGSDWATGEMHRVVCADAEEAFWVASLQADLKALKSVLDADAASLLENVEAVHGAHRDDACGLMRDLHKDEPRAAYAACSTEASARTAVDLFVLRGAAERRAP